MIYGYARVSTTGQAANGNSLETQEKKLRQNGATEIYTDIYTGTKGERPELSKLLERIEPGDTLMAVRLDRLMRSAWDGGKLIESLVNKGVEVKALDMNMVINNSSMGKAFLGLVLVFAQLERDLIVERTQEGKAIAKQKPGFREGRPREYTPEQLRHAVELLNTHSYTQVEAMTKISKSTLQRAKRESKARE